MKHPFSITTQQLILPDQHITYRLYKNPAITGGRKLVLLHGAGVAGVDTWNIITAFLSHWGEVLVPDLRGMGDTVYPDGKEHAFTAQMLVADVNALVDQLGWWAFDLGGYSMGGLVSLLFKQQHSDRIGKQFLLESAVLDRACWNSTVVLRQHYTAAAQHLRQDNVRHGVLSFLDAISPNRRISPQVEAVTIKRLGYRPQGFANALDCVTDAINHIDRDTLVAAQGDVTSFIGSNSVELMHEYQKQLAERLPNWHYFMMPGTDHSLPYQKPRQIARIMNAEMSRFMAGSG
ncbi:MAG: alpha/beta fold hydrolase [Pontibacterium sp.]